MSEKKTWFVTFVTHNSRISERMVTYGIQRGEPIIFSEHEQLDMARCLLICIQKYNVPVLAWNVLPDHVHMVLLAEDDKHLQDLIRKIKGYSAYQHNLINDRGSIWAQKFYSKVIVDQEILMSVLHYVMNNHLKHIETWGNRLIETWDNGLSRIIERGCISLEE